MDDFNGHDMCEFYAWNGEPNDQMLPLWCVGDEVDTPEGPGPVCWTGWMRSRSTHRYGVKLEGYEDLQFFDEGELGEG